MAQMFARILAIEIVYYRQKCYLVQIIVIVNKYHILPIEDAPHILREVNNITNPGHKLESWEPKLAIDGRLRGDILDNLIYNVPVF